jgi:hypothetical protein
VEGTQKNVHRPSTDLAAIAVLIAPAAFITAALAAKSGACGALINIFDVRLVNYFLEWAYRYFHGGTGSDSVWSPPFFYPAENVLAYSETFFAAWPFYFPARLVGFGPQGALLFYQIAQLALTPVVGYICGRWLGLGRVAAFVAAWCFGWSWIRFNQLAHIQFANGWVIALMFALLYRGLREARPWLLAATAWTLCCAWFTSLYIAYFSVLVAAIVIGLWAVQGPPKALNRASALLSAIARMPRRELVGWLIVGAAPFLLMAYGGYHYSEAARVVGPGNPGEALLYQPSIWSFLRPGSANMLWGRFSSLVPWDPEAPWEKQLFLGWLALACVLASLVFPGGGEDNGLSTRSLRSTAAAVLVGTLLVSHFSMAVFNTPYLFALHHLPGLAALRVAGRIVLVLSALSAFVAAVVVQRVMVRVPFAAFVLAVGLVLEATPPLPPIADRCQADRPWRALEPALCRVLRDQSAGTLLFLPMDEISFDRIFDQVPEMTLALDCGVATINGYTGKEAPAVAPLLHSDPAHFNCAAARSAVEAAAARSGRNTLVYLEEAGPLGPPAYPPSSVADCFSSCLAGQNSLAVEGRKGRVLVLDHARKCGPALAGP